MSSTIQKKKGGPYSKQSTEKRRNEVYRLYFDYGYSARKISDMMKINRNTINADISYWYSQIYTSEKIYDPETTILVNLRRLQEQRIRLRTHIDKTTEFQEKMSLERMIFDIDVKTIQVYQKLAESTKRIVDTAIEHFNEYMKENNMKTRYIKLFDKISVSPEAKEKIEEITKEDRKPSN